VFYLQLLMPLRPNSASLNSDTPIINENACFIHFTVRYSKLLDKIINEDTTKNHTKHRQDIRNSRRDKT
jgi:hypothetical protein